VDKRFVGFFVLAIAMVVLNLLLGQLFRKPPAPPKAAQKDEQKQDQKAEEEEQKKEDIPEAKQKPPGQAEESSPELAYEGEPPEPPVLDREPLAEKQPPVVPEKKPPAQPQVAERPERWLTLGSLERGPDNPYRMLVTLTSRGAAVRRVELASESFRDLEFRDGYLGELALKAQQNAPGCIVRVVGAGTPAAAAGLQPGDILTVVAERNVDRPGDLDLALRKIDPNTDVTLEIVRGGKQQTLQATLGRRPLAVLRPELENIAARNRQRPSDDQEAIPEDLPDPPSLLLTLHQLDEEQLGEDEEELEDVDLRTGNWEVVKAAADEAVFRRALPSGLVAVKRYRLAEVPEAERDNAYYPAYHLTLDIEFRNEAPEPLRLAYQLDGPTGLPTEGWWYGGKVGRSMFGSVGLRDYIGRWYGKDPLVVGAAEVATANFDEDDSDELRPKRDASLIYAGVDAQYFAAVLIPQKEKAQSLWLQQTAPIRLGPKPEKDLRQLVNVSTRMISMKVTLEPQEQFSHRYQLFTGPKQPDLVAQYEQPAVPTYTLSDLVYYGWFGKIAGPMLAILHFFYGIVGNYGLAIVMLTVLVRGLMFPLSRKQAQNMVKMQQLQPELKKLQEKYKDDLEKRTKAQQELFRRENYNPMGGCLLMLLQLPIFLGLYRALMVDIELRQAPLISDSIRWCSNLAAPDMLLDWSGWMWSPVQGFLGPYLNVLPLVTVALFLTQQKMFMPPPADEQAAMQQKIMTYMMIFIGFLFYKVASGLCLYFIASTLWGMAERKLLPKPTPGTTGGAPAATASKSSRRSAESGDGAARSSRNGQNRGTAKKKKKQKKR